MCALACPSHASGPVLTDGHATVGAAEVDVTLRDGGHADLIEGPGEEGSKGAAEGHRPIASGAAHCDAHLGVGRGTQV